MWGVGGHGSGRAPADARGRAGAGSGLSMEMAASDTLAELVAGGEDGFEPGVQGRRAVDRHVDRRRGRPGGTVGGDRRGGDAVASARYPPDGRPRRSARTCQRSGHQPAALRREGRHRAASPLGRAARGQRAGRRFLDPDPGGGARGAGGGDFRRGAGPPAARRGGARWKADGHAAAGRVRVEPVRAADGGRGRRDGCGDPGGGAEPHLRGGGPASRAQARRHLPVRGEPPGGGGRQRAGHRRRRRRRGREARCGRTPLQRGRDPGAAAVRRVARPRAGCALAGARPGRGAPSGGPRGGRRAGVDRGDGASAVAAVGGAARRAGAAAEALDREHVGRAREKD